LAGLTGNNFLTQTYFNSLKMKYLLLTFQGCMQNSLSQKMVSNKIKACTHCVSENF